jgi:D-alanyl-D-alanine carboxypeptidase/D-alanyl-D-alanine-endopeptidase (penicillin-binding protein 4)
MKDPLAMTTAGTNLPRKDGSPRRLRWPELLLAGALGMAHVLTSYADPLPDDIRQAMAAQKVPIRAISLVVQDVNDPQPILSVEASRARHPASVIKLLTTLSGLELLGPDYTWSTEAYRRGPLQNDTLSGDLVIKGYGDPFLVTERFWLFLRALRDRGVGDIAGSLVLDSSYFETQPGRPGDFDGKPYRVYNAIPDALTLNFQSTEFQMIPDAEVDGVRLTTMPPLANLSLENGLRLVSGPCRSEHRYPKFDIDSGQNGARVRLTGSLTLECDKLGLNRLTLPPSTHLYGGFRALWSELGGQFNGTLQLGRVGPDDVLLYRQSSPPLSELMRGMNKFSNNFMTRQLLLTVGAEMSGPPGTVAKGREAILSWLDSHRLALPELVLDNGAGLSRDTRISAAGLARLLQVGYQSPYMPEFISSLPLAALDGTMRRRLKTDVLAGRAHIKTGSLRDVSAMAGYLTLPGGKRRIVVALINHPGIRHWQGWEIQDAVLRWAYAQD